RIFIGDIQGCREELERLLGVLKYDSSLDALEPVGDFVNRGPDSLGTLRLLKSLGAGGVLGNHDLHLLAARRGARSLKSWDTLSQVLKAQDCEDLLAWLRAKPFVKAWPDVILVHAGLSPAWVNPAAALAGLDPESAHPRIDLATRLRWCDARGETPPSEDDPPDEPGFRPWFDHLKGRFRETVVFGHWARLGLVNRIGFRGLDSGCVWGGRLTAWIAEDDSFMSVPAAKVYARD
ncbi:MAG: metallophosphoesterase, partial [Vicinamibacteria bacterium]|nr:metallophosphoesterase [Vicinamibacteria bacterium]